MSIRDRRPNLVRRFVVTHKPDDGMRQLTFPQQGRYTDGTLGEAMARLEQFRTPEGLERVLSADELATLEIRPVLCYPGHNDPAQLYFPDQPVDGLTVQLEDRGDFLIGYFNFVLQD